MDWAPIRLYVLLWKRFPNQRIKLEEFLRVRVEKERKREREWECEPVCTFGFANELSTLTQSEQGLFGVYSHKNTASNNELVIRNQYNAKMPAP